MYATDQSYKDMQHRFNHHSPTPVKAAFHESIRRNALELANRLDEKLPPGREKSTAITKLEEVMFWANAAIARHRPSTNDSNGSH